MNVSIFVVQPGYWGHLTVSVAVVVPPPSLWQRAAPFAAVAGVGLVALAGALYVRWRHKRRPRLPIPPLALPPPPPGGPGNQSPAVSRTPP